MGIGLLFMVVEFDFIYGFFDFRGCGVLIGVLMGVFLGIGLGFGLL